MTLQHNRQWVRVLSSIYIHAMQTRRQWLPTLKPPLVSCPYWVKAKYPQHYRQGAYFRWAFEWC